MSETRTRSASWERGSDGYFVALIREHASNELPGRPVWRCEHLHFSSYAALSCAMLQREIIEGNA